ncbi:hypothetical protein [Streptomyces sp. NPDC059753]|uniref:hypothetical protein n=1 Tax=Streptomyces sp. NPDC059753 TaxID=3346933 RepID=UPI003647D387
MPHVSAPRGRSWAASGGTKASVQAVAERADVGLRSVCSHFTGKSGLFDVAAVDDALEE